jgi:1-aminocyclopropane-1-carboxylate deaminase/D-cysteine desulfhydrase-like pyridoxal-dependent ACC family enzyme
MARSLGARVHFIPANRLSVNYTQARRYVEARGGVMLPFGMECPEAVDSVASEAACLPRELLHNGTVVLCCGSGITLAGLLRGLPVSPRRIIGVSSGRALSQIEKCVNRHVGNLPINVQLVPASMPYHETPVITCPFPCHPHYDLKAWEHLSDHLDDYDDPILFWNVGG